MKSRVIAEPLLIIHFCLASIDPTGSPASLVASYIELWLAKNNFLFKEVIFDLSTEENVGEHDKKMKKFVGQIQR